MKHVVLNQRTDVTERRLWLKPDLIILLGFSYCLTSYNLFA